MGRGALVRFGLWRVPQHRTRVNLVVCADLGPAGQISVRHHARASFDLDRALDYDIGADVCARVDLGLGIDDGRGMNRHGSAADVIETTLSMLHLDFSEGKED